MRIGGGHSAGRSSLLLIALLVLVSNAAQPAKPGDTYDLRDLEELKVKESGDKKAAYVKEYAKYDDKLKAAEAASKKAVEAAVQGRLAKKIHSWYALFLVARVCSRGL